MIGSLQTKVMASHRGEAPTSAPASTASAGSSNARNRDADPLTAYDIVQRLGGRARVAQHCGAAVNTVCGWYLSNIPASRVAELYDLACALGQHDLTFEVLHRAAARPPRPKAPAGSGPSRTRSNARG